MVSVVRGKEIARLRQGFLRLAVGEESVWEDRRQGRSATLRQPFELKPTGEKVSMVPKFERYELGTADGTYELAVPKKGAELVRTSSVWHRAERTQDSRGRSRTSPGALVGSTANF
jgi:hypothetical protein